MYRWIRENKFKFIVLIVVLIVILVFVMSLIIHDRNEDGNIINKGNEVVSNFTTGIENSISDTFHGLFRYKDLQKKLDNLERENMRLESELNEALIEREELENLEELSKVLNFEYVKQNFDLISGSVTSYDGSNFATTFTINIGTEKGVEVGDPVVNGDGLVGKVTQAGDTWAKVTAICDIDSKISFKLERNRSDLGVCEGTSNVKLEGFMMDAESSVQAGDAIITSGLGTYPEGLEIGTVKSVEYNSSTLLREIVVEPQADFNRLDKVAVIKNYTVKNSDEKKDEKEE